MTDIKNLSPDYANLIDEGGYGDIYRCKENQNYIVKMIQKSENNGECNKKIINKLSNHHNIMKIVGIDQNRYNAINLIYLQYVKGEDLSKYLFNNQINDHIRYHITQQILSGLDYLHQNKITHRDIKLNNIIIEPSSYHITIIDFGLACYGYPCKGLVGTSGFFAPEMIYSENNYNSLCDIWSTGCILYYLVSNTFPFYSSCNRDSYIQQLTDFVKIKYNKDIWNNNLFLKLTKHMLIYDYQKRWSANQCLNYLSSHSNRICDQNL